MNLENYSFDYDPRVFRLKDWARRLRYVPFKKDDFLGYRWEYLRQNEDEMEDMWRKILYRRHCPLDEFDFSFIEEEYVADHIFWAHWITYNALLDAQFSKPGILMNGITLPERYQARGLGPFDDSMRRYRHAAPVIDVEPMEEFSYAETLQENDEYLIKLWKRTFKGSRVILGHSLWLEPFWKKVLKWERASELARWDVRARQQRRSNFIASWAPNYGDQPAWMHRNKRIAENLDFIWHDVGNKILKLKSKNERRRAWNEAYIWNPNYLKPRQNIHQQEPLVIYQRWTWEQERLALERMVPMSKKLAERRFNEIAQRHLCWNEDIERYVYIPKIKTPRPYPMPHKKQVYKFDEFGNFVDPPPPHVNVIHYRDEDEQQQKYDDFIAAKKDVRLPFPPTFWLHEETKQAIWDDYFTNKKSKTLGELFDKNKNDDRLLPVFRWRKNCYDPHVPKPKNPHPYLVRGTAAEKIKQWKKNKLWKAKMADYVEKLKQGLKPRHPSLPPPPPPLPYTPKEHLTFTHQDHIRRMRRGDRHAKFVELNGESSMEDDEEFSTDWIYLIVDRLDPKTGKLMTIEEFIRIRDEELRIKKAQEEWDAKHFPYYKDVVDRTTLSHVIGIRSRGCSYAMAKMVDHKEWFKTNKRRPVPIEYNEFLEQLDGFDTMSSLSEKAGRLVNVMKRQIAAADDILKSVHLPDGGKNWNLERKSRRSPNDSNVP